MDRYQVLDHEANTTVNILAVNIQQYKYTKYNSKYFDFIMRNYERMIADSYSRYVHLHLKVIQYKLI